MRKVVETLGFEKHPALHELLQARAHSTKIHTALATKFYRSDAVGMFHDTSEQYYQHDRLKAKRKRAAATAAGLVRSPLSLPTVMGYALLDHFRRTLKPGMIISFPASALPCQALSRALMGDMQAPRSRSRLILVDRNPDDDDYIRNDSIIFAKVLHMTPAAWKTVQIPAHQGGRFSDRAVAFAPLKIVSDLGDVKLLAGALGEEILVVHEWDQADLLALREHCQVWAVMPRQDPLLFLPGQALVSDTSLSELLHWLIRQRACAKPPWQCARKAGL